MAKNNQNSKPENHDFGYKAYIAAFAVMLIIVIAAVCILSGCLDKFIFGNTTPDTDANNSSDSISVTDKIHTNSPTVTENTDKTGVDTETNSPVTDSDSGKSPESTSQKTDETTKSPETTKGEEETTTKEQETTKKPETTSAPETTKEPETTKTPETTAEPAKNDELFDAPDDSILYDFANKALTITGYANGDAKTIKVSNTLDGVEVKTIGAGAFKNMDSLEKVTISYGVTTIGADAFGGCSALTYVYIPESVTLISENAFDGSDKIVINCKKGSYAERYAKENSIEYKTK